MSFKRVGSQLWGSDGYARYIEASEALHRFARATGCPPGQEVSSWFRMRTEEADMQIGKDRDNPPA